MIMYTKFRMKFIAKLILIILIVPLFIIGILAAVIKFQLLSPTFWENTLSKYNVYLTLTTVIKNSIETQTVSEGGSKSSVKIITDLVTTDNVKDFIDRNLNNLLSYANGEVNTLSVYIPVGRAPKGFLPQNFENLPETMPLSSLLTKLNVTGITSSQIQYISVVGKTVTYVLILDLALLVLFLIFLLLLENPGSRFIAPGIAFILVGAITIGFWAAGTQIRMQSTAAPDAKNLLTAQIIFGAVAPPVILEILKTWIVVGATAVLIGILFFFIKKPGKLPL